MSDASDKETALEQLAMLAEIEVEPTLTPDELEVILDRHKRATRYPAATALTYGDVIMPTIRNGHRYLVTVAGTTGTEPTWPTTFAGTVGGAPKFQEAGIDYDNVYDIRAALQEVWIVKRSRASEMVNNSESGSEGQIFENCDRMVKQYASPFVA